VDRESRKDIRIVTLLLLVAGGTVLVAWLLGGPLVTSIGEAVAPGMGLRDAALWSFGLTVAVIVVFAVAAGDSLFGELQYMLAAFFIFFVINWLLIAWIF
jgi:hypothetical protein